MWEQMRGFGMTCPGQGTEDRTGLSTRGSAGSPLDNSCEVEKEFQHPSLCCPSEPEGPLAKGKPPHT